MLLRQVVAARSLLRTTKSVHARGSLVHTRGFSDVDDPNMNGGYQQPPPIKRQFRDPYGDWWDKQERRNYGEPVHEDNDILGVFSPEEYTHTPPGKGALQLGTFVAAVLGLCFVVSRFYPDKPSVPKEYEGGLDRELGGEGALWARKKGDHSI
ncbi:MAG: hypothetical protein M1824_006088 [Vezdaea acicularis]|nr:MAG: hypothetical protein M1824_006088 [Vezdaea acicularis]